jgi:hypothetical protein
LFRWRSVTPSRSLGGDEPANIGGTCGLIGRKVTEEDRTDMTRTIILAAAAGALAMTSAAPASAQYNRNWRTIAYKTVNGRDTDNIRVPGTARYRQLRVCVSGGPIHMRDVDVWFRNGRHQDIGTRNLMRAGTCTRNLDLRGYYRDVTRVRLKYAPLARGWVRPLVRVQVR